MKKILTATLSLVCFCTLSISLHAEPEHASASLTTSQQQALATEAKSHIKTLATALKSTLQHGMKTAGPAASVSLCQIQAPAITKATSKQVSDSSWSISRTSLQPRSLNNTPDAWVIQVMKDFEKRKVQGEDVSQISHSEIRNNQYYFIKAIPTQAACLACHGKKLTKDVAITLKQLYPNDKATGFNIGDIRGVFIAKKQLIGAIHE